MLIFIVLAGLVIAALAAQRAVAGRREARRDRASVLGHLERFHRLRFAENPDEVPKPGQWMVVPGAEIATFRLGEHRLGVIVDTRRPKRPLWWVLFEAFAPDERKPGLEKRVARVEAEFADGEAGGKLARELLEIAIARTEAADRARAFRAEAGRPFAPPIAAEPLP